jgi:elongator complex protein 5
MYFYDVTVKETARYRKKSHRKFKMTRVSSPTCYTIYQETRNADCHNVETLVVFDSLHPLFAQDSFNPTPFLSALTTPTTSMLAIFHTSVPLATSFTTYTPPPLSMLRYLATAILTVHSLNHIITKKRALDRSEAPPLLGLEEGLDGAVLALGSNDPLGSVIEMEHRRRSGRSVVEWFYVPHAGKREPIVLLEDHPAYPRAAQDANASGDAVVSGTTFELGLSEAQRREREKVVLPYFDAQSEGGVGQGGRILYDLGAEDDFDEEEDEI